MQRGADYCAWLWQGRRYMNISVVDERRNWALRDSLVVFRIIAFAPSVRRTRFVFVAQSGGRQRWRLARVFAPPLDLRRASVAAIAAADLGATSGGQQTFALFARLGPSVLKPNPNDLARQAKVLGESGDRLAIRQRVLGEVGFKRVQLFATEGASRRRLARFAATLAASRRRLDVRPRRLGRAGRSDVIDWTGHLLGRRRHGDRHLHQRSTRPG